MESGHTKTSLFSPLPLDFGVVVLSPKGLDIQEDVTTCEKLFSLWGFGISEIGWRFTEKAKVGGFACL